MVKGAHRPAGAQADSWSNRLSSPMLLLLLLHRLECTAALRTWHWRANRADSVPCKRLSNAAGSTGFSEPITLQVLRVQTPGGSCWWMGHQVRGTPGSSSLHATLPPSSCPVATATAAARQGRACFSRLQHKQSCTHSSPRALRTCTIGAHIATARNCCVRRDSGAAPLRMRRTRPPSLALMELKASRSASGEACSSLWDTQHGAARRKVSGERRMHSLIAGRSEALISGRCKYWQYRYSASRN